MKKRAVLLAVVIQIMALCACGKAEEEIPVETGMAENEPEWKSHILISYFSQPTDVDTSDLDAVSGASVIVRDGEAAGSTTEWVARLIKEVTGGDLFRIEAVDEYPSDYEKLVAQARQEKGENVRPELAGHIENPEQYDTIILGYPSWLAYHNLIQCT